MLALHSSLFKMGKIQKDILNWIMTVKVMAVENMLFPCFYVYFFFFRGTSWTARGLWCRWWRWRTCWWWSPSPPWTSPWLIWAAGSEPPVRNIISFNSIIISHQRKCILKPEKDPQHLQVLLKDDHSCPPCPCLAACPSPPTCSLFLQEQEQNSLKFGGPSPLLRSGRLPEIKSIMGIEVNLCSYFWPACPKWPPTPTPLPITFRGMLLNWVRIEIILGSHLWLGQGRVRSSQAPDRGWLCWTQSWSWKNLWRIWRWRGSRWPGLVWTRWGKRVQSQSCRPCTVPPPPFPA